MPNSYFQFKEFRIDQQQAGMKVTTDACLFGAWVANRIQQKEEPKHILDIGAGTGLLALMLAQATQISLIDAVEMNESVADEALSNFQKSKWNSRLQIHPESIQQFKPAIKYDLIICNPPFFKDHPRGLSENKRQAIHSTDGFMEDLAKDMKRLLHPLGLCYVLYPEKEMNEFIKWINSVGLELSKKILVRNEVNKPTFRVLAEFSSRKASKEEAEIIIRRGDRKYTNDFWRLLKDYYLDYNDPEIDNG